MKKPILLIFFVLFAYQFSFSQQVHLVTIGSTENQTQIERIFNPDTTYAIKTGIELANLLLNMEVKKDDALLLIYTGLLSVDSSFVLDNFKFKMSNITNLLKDKNASFVLSLWNTDSNLAAIPTQDFSQIVKKRILIEGVCRNMTSLIDFLKKDSLQNIHQENLSLSVKENPFDFRTGSSIYDIPEFPMPIPIPTAQKDVEKEWLKNCKNLGQINQKLVASLDKNGYKEKCYYRMPNGFALVALIEKINDDGSPKPNPERWEMGIDGNKKSFSLENYLKALFFVKNPAYYRIIVFAVTNSLLSYKKEKATPAETESWLKEGVKGLPKEISELPYSRSHQVVALIYEFEKQAEGKTPRMLGRNEGKPVHPETHLNQSGIWKSLRK